MGYNLFLDDIRMPKDAFGYMNLPIYIEKKWIVVRNYYAFTTLIQNKGVPEVISFDHDLADEHYDYQEQFGNHDIYDIIAEKTGYHCAKWLVNYCIDNNKEVPTEILIHSMNPAGTLNIRSVFTTYFKAYEIKHNPIIITPTIRG